MDKYNLYKFFSKRATALEEENILDWMDASPENHDEFIRERNLYNMLLLHSIEEQELVPNRKTSRIWVKEFIRIAAVLLLVFGMYWHYSKKEEAMFAEVNTITVPYGQRMDLELPDGTKICLNAGSELKYPALFSKGSRRVELRGNAFFEVTHDPDNPFTVETELYDIKVLGTRFDVEAYPNTGKVLTTLVEGKIVLADKKNTDRQIELYPGQEAYYVGDRFLVNSVKNPDRLRWREGLLCFQDETLAGLIEEFEKFYDVQIVVNKKEILDHELSGKLKIGDGIEHALRVLQKSIPFRYSRSNENDNTIIIE